eukprot:15126839-Alexandrium_andersonii.AAC.1
MSFLPLARACAVARPLRGGSWGGLHLWGLGGGVAACCVPRQSGRGVPLWRVVGCGGPLAPPARPAW